MSEYLQSNGISIDSALHGFVTESVLAPLALDGEPLKIHQTRLTDAPVGEEPIGLLKGNAKSGLFVRCADYWLEILVLQATGGKRLAAKDYLVGKTLEGKVLI